MIRCFEYLEISIILREVEKDAMKGKGNPENIIKFDCKFYDACKENKNKLYYIWFIVLFNGFQRRQRSVSDARQSRHIDT